MATAPKQPQDEVIIGGTDPGNIPVAKVRGIRVFSYPKVIYLYPSFFLALIAGIAMLFYEERSDYIDDAVSKETTVAAPAEATTPATTTTTTGPRRLVKFGTPQNIIGVIFLGVLLINLVVMSLDFPRFTILAGIFLGTTILLVLILLGEHFHILRFFTFIFGGLYVYANAAFYFVFATILLIIGLLVYGTRWLDYWEIRPNEILHHHGPLSDLERFPTFNLKFDKEIPDVFEYLLLRAGRLVLTVPGEPRAIVLENVPRINRVETQLKELMSRLKVTSGDSA